MWKISTKKSVNLYVLSTIRPNDGRSISQNVASLNRLLHDVIIILYYEHRKDKQKHFYVQGFQKD